MYESFDETAAKVLLALDPGDSIREVAMRLQAPYETVRQAVNRLEHGGYLRYDNGVYLTDGRVREAARELLARSAVVSEPSIEEAYLIPQFGDWPFAFARIDAVYVWTQGGYQVGRTPEDYPLFIAVHERDTEAWQTFFERFGLPTAFERQPASSLDGSIQVVLEPRSEFDIDEVDGYPVIPREEAVAYMREHYAHFQSALAMLDRMYDDFDTDVDYRESERVRS